MDAPSLYETDILAWSEQQAAVLRRLAARPDRPNELDFENVVEEIESVGRSQLNAAESYIRLILEHLVKLASVPASPARAHWIGEIANWHSDLETAISPSMHQRIDMDRVWRRALRVAETPLAADEHAILPRLPRRCPIRLVELMAEDFDAKGAVARIRAAAKAC